MAQYKDKRSKLLRRDTFEGKKVTLAETDQIEAHGELAVHFMSTIFDQIQGDYLITDESDVMDFAPFDESDTTAIWRRIVDAYGIHEADVGSGRLVKIFDAIAARRRIQ